VCDVGLVRRWRISNEEEQNTRLHEINTRLFLFYKKKTCAKRKTKRMFLVKVFTEGKKDVGKAFLSKKRFNEEPCGKPQGINSHITNTAAATLWQATGNPQVESYLNT
jgi:hypothetical protein